MAHLHFRRTVYKSGGSKAKARVEYMTRESARDRRAARQLRYIGRADREDLVYTQSRNLPAWAAGNALTYFRAAEQYERALGNAFEEWKITLPQELSPRQNMALMRDLVETIAGDRLPITYAFHCPTTMDKTQPQPHLHCLISGRQDDGIARTPAQHFTRYNSAHPERGGAPKDPALYHLRAVKQWRVTISDVVNLHLARAGCAARIHPDRLDDRDLTRPPEPKLLPSESRAYRDTGVVSDTMAAVLAIRAQRTATQRAEQADARAYWDERKTVLGITDAMDGTVQLAAICTARAQVRDQAPAREVVLGEVGVERDERMLGDMAGEAYAQAWDEVQGVWERMQEEQALCDVGWEAVRQARKGGSEALAESVQEQHAREHARAWNTLEHDLQALAQQLDALSAEAGSPGQVRIRLWDREPGLGLS